MKVSLKDVIHAVLEHEDCDFISVGFIGER